MESEITYTVVAYNQMYLGRLVSLEVYKTTSKVTEANNFLTITIRNGLSVIRTPFTETIEKDKTYYFGGEKKAITTNRTTPIEAVRDAFDCLTRKFPTEFEPNLLSMTMGRIANTLRKMYQEGNISNVRFIMRQDQRYYLACLDTEGNLTMIHSDFR